MAIVTLFYRCRNCSKDFTETVLAGSKSASQVLRGRLGQPEQGAVDHECGPGCDNLIGVADMIAACDGEVA